MVPSFKDYLLIREIETRMRINSILRNLFNNIQSGLDTKPVGRFIERSNRRKCLGSAWRMRSDVNYQQEIDSSMTTHDSINLLMSFLKLEISEEL